MLHVPLSANMFSQLWMPVPDTGVGLCCQALYTDKQPGNSMVAVAEVMVRIGIETGGESPLEP